MPIITIYHKGGRVEILPQNYPGTMCHQATAPYEEARSGAKSKREGEEGVSATLPLAQVQQHKAQ